MVVQTFPSAVFLYGIGHYLRHAPAVEQSWWKKQETKERRNAALTKNVVTQFPVKAGADRLQRVLFFVKQTLSVLNAVGKRGRSY